jgi:hypothetical protein
MVATVKEASTCTVTARFYDTGNSNVAPTTVRYLIRDLTNNRVVKDWTSVSSAAEVEIRISAQDNEILRSRRPKLYEKRVVVIQADAGEVNQHTNEHEYWIYNLSGLLS